VKTLVQHLVVFDRYTPLFETGYLALTEAFYAKEAADCAASLRDDAKQYMAIADGRIGEEEERCEAVATGETLTMVSGACLVAFLEKERLAWLTAHSEAVPRRPREICSRARQRSTLSCRSRTRTRSPCCTTCTA
jgi:hypothetical protein